MNKKQQKATELEQRNALTGLTPTQEQAAILLASGVSFTDVSLALNVNRGTLYKWQNLVGFQCFYNLQCSDIRENLKHSLMSMTGEAINAITELLHSDNDAIKLKAAEMIINRVFSLNIGETNPKEVIKRQFSMQEDWERGCLDNLGYHNALKDFGLE